MPNRRFRLKSVAVASVLSLAACATAATTYGPAEGTDGFGYSSQQIESGRHTVRFTGTSPTGSGLISDFALLRAAELTLAEGRSWFRVVNRGVEVRGGGGSGVSTSIGGGTSIGRGGGSYGGVGISFGGSPGASVYTATLEILTGEGEPPADDANVFMAEDVVRNLRPAPEE